MRNHQAGSQPLRFAAIGFHVGGCPLVGVDGPGEFFFDARPQHFDRNIASIGRDRSMHLGDRGRADGDFVEARVERFERLAEGGLNDLLDRREWGRRQVILKQRKVFGGLLADKVRPGRQRLAELDRSRADREQGRRIVRRRRDPRADSADSREPPHSRRSHRIFFDTTEGSVASQRPAPLSQTP